MEPGIPDEVVLQTANREGAMLLTEDKDFGELAFRQGLIHRGVILIRLAGVPVSTKAAMLIEFLENHSSELPEAFTVLAPGMARIRKPGFPDEV